MNITQDHIAIWERCLGQWKTLVPEKQFATWFTTIKPLSLVDGVLVVEVPSDWFRQYLEETYIDVIAKVLKQEIGPDVRLKYRVRPLVNQASMTVDASQNAPFMNRITTIPSEADSVNPDPYKYMGLRKHMVNPQLNPTYCFRNLIMGECNKLGINAGIDISSKPGKTPFNPLFIFGGPGLGKTHLAMAIGNAIHEQHPDLIVLYVTGNQFKTQYMNAIQGNKLTDFLAFYMRMDVLILDDIHDLVGAGNQTAFFNVFNHLHQNGKQLILTSDRAPKDLVNFEERLLSRFKWGLSVELLKPDFNTRLAMLKGRCSREGIIVEDSVLEHIALSIKTNFRELEGALLSLIAHATYMHQDCTLELANKVIGQIAGEEVNDLSISKVQQAVCQYFNVSKDELLSSTRKRQVVQARQISMYLSRNLISNCSLASIGEEYGGRDHSTVLHACSIVSDLMGTDKLFKKYVTDLESILQPQYA